MLLLLLVAAKSRFLSGIEMEEVVDDEDEDDDDDVGEGG